MKNLEFMEALIETYKDMVYDLSVRLTKSHMEAEDLFQDTWLKIAKNIEKINKESNVKNYIYTVCINTYKNKYSKDKRWLSIIKDYFTTEEKELVINNASDELNILEDMCFKYDEDMIKKSIDKLKDIYKIPIILFYYKDYKYEEIANILLIPIGTVKYRINMAKRILKKELYVLDCEVENL